MNREDLKKMAVDFFSTFYYKSKTITSKNAILFSRPTGMGISDDMLVYFHQKGEEDYLENNLNILNNDFSNIDDNRRFFLTNAPLGIVPESVTKFKFKYQVPVQFFNREFSSDKKTTPLKNLEADVKKFEDERIEQPFSVNGVTDNHDILENLYGEIVDSSESCIRIVIAPAGYGKTVLMSSLYNKLSTNFKELKSKQKLAQQPLIMLPGHIKRANDIDDLINNFIGEEYDFGIASPETFKFWINNGFAVWLLDGLEELILKIPEEFIYKLLDYFVYSQSSKNTQIVISIRKPLLAASQEFKDILQNWTGTGIKIYELTDWTNTEKVKYFTKNLIDEDANFLSDINKNNLMSEICKIPYYCSLVADLKNNNDLTYLNDEIDLVDYSFEKICEREFGKGLDKDIFTIDKQRELFAELSLDNEKVGWLTEENLKEWANVYIPDEVQTNDRVEQLACIQRHAVLSYTGTNLEFVHDIMKQYLIGRVLSKDLRNNNINNFDSLLIEDGSFLLKYIIRNLDKTDWEPIFIELNNISSLKNEEAFGFRNILKIYLGIVVDNKEGRLEHHLNNKNLSNLTFIDLDLNGFGFQNSKLENTAFINCNLSDANFSGCDFNETFFDDNCKMINVEINDSLLQSLKIKNKSIYDQKEILSYFYKRTSKPVDAMEPCQATINLTKIFSKLIKKGKVYPLPKKYIIGTKCGGGISANQIIDTAIRKGYITEDHKGCLKLRLNLFDETNEFCKNRKLSDGIRKILDNVCRNSAMGCKHLN